MSSFKCSASAAGARRQRGSVAIEFVLVFAIFLSAVLAMIDFSRWLFAVNAVNEAAREGARTAVVCDKNSSAISTRMAPLLAFTTPGSVVITYSPSGACTVDTCDGVTVSLSGYTVPAIAPFLPRTLSLPTATTFLPRESMRSTLAGNANLRCS